MAPTRSNIVNPISTSPTFNDVLSALKENNIIQWLMLGFGLPSSFWIIYKVVQRVPDIYCAPHPA